MMRLRSFSLILIAGLPCIGVSNVRALEGLNAAGGGSPKSATDRCIPAAEETRIVAAISKFKASHPSAFAALPPPTGIAKYAFFPQAGTVWEDLFANNFVDLDPTAGILDYHGTAYTYDGHQGVDVDLCTFTEQSVGVPVFAALPGVVAVAHDGESDMNTTQVAGTLANYVVLQHSGTQQTWYYHLKKNSVAVTAGQNVVAGQQLGLTASSGYSTGPHLHFESRYAGTFFEAFTGTSNPGTSGWISQIPFKSAMYVRDFNVTADNLSSWPGPPTDTTRTGTVGTGTQTRYFWALIQSLPASTTYQFRFIRPNGTVRFDSGSRALSAGNPFYKWSYWWWSWNVNYDVAGTWTVEFSLNGQVQFSAPLTVSASAAVNRAPYAVTASLDPPVADSTRVIFCRVSHHVLDDPDYDVVRYRYVWKRNGTTVRDSTNASLADAVPTGTCVAGDTLECTVTPSDGVLTATPVTTRTTIYQTYAQWATGKGIGTGAPTADDDRDGLPNLVEYALDSPPTNPTALPAPTRNATSGAVEWTLPVHPYPDPGVTLMVETSTDLATWTAATPNGNRTLWTAGASGDVQRFMRIRVTGP